MLCGTGLVVDEFRLVSASDEAGTSENVRGAAHQNHQDRRHAVHRRVRYNGKSRPTNETNV